jgi:hypothetical protein
MVRKLDLNINHSDVYLSVDLEQLIAEAAQRKMSLPASFKVVAQLVGKDGELLSETKAIVSNYPENFSYHNTRITLPKSALEDFQAHIQFQFLSQDSPSKSVPSVSKFVTPSHSNSDAKSIF